MAQSIYVIFRPDASVRRPWPPPRPPKFLTATCCLPLAGICLRMCEQAKERDFRFLLQVDVSRRQVNSLRHAQEET